MERGKRISVTPSLIVARKEAKTVRSQITDELRDPYNIQAFKDTLEYMHAIYRDHQASKYEYPEAKATARKLAYRDLQTITNKIKEGPATVPQYEERYETMSKLCQKYTKYLKAKRPSLQTQSEPFPIEAIYDLEGMLN